jgi:hypothetical protein
MCVQVKAARPYLWPLTYPLYNSEQLRDSYEADSEFKWSCLACFSLASEPLIKREHSVGAA